MPPDLTEHPATAGTSQPAGAPTGAREGSTLYYSLLKVEPRKRKQLLHLLTLCKTLASSLHDVGEVTVAEKKLHWWHEEIERLHSHSEPARHPATIALTDIVREYAIVPEYWYAILRSNNDEKFINPADNKAFMTRLETDYGARIALCCQLLGGVGLPARQDWATGLGLFDRLAHFRDLHQCGYPVLPDSDYSAAGIDPADIYNATKRDAVTTMFKSRIADALEHLQRAQQSTEQADNIGAGVLPFVTLATLRNKQLSVWLKHRVRPSERYITLTPLRKAWTGFRTRMPS